MIEWKGRVHGPSAYPIQPLLDLQTCLLGFLILEHKSYEPNTQETPTQYHRHVFQACPEITLQP